MNVNLVPSNRALRNAASLTYAALLCAEALEKLPTDIDVGLDVDVDLWHPFFAYMIPSDAWGIFIAGSVVWPKDDCVPPAGITTNIDQAVDMALARADTALWLAPHIGTVVALAWMIESRQVATLGEAVEAVRAIAETVEPPSPQ